jgi:hypothetical protein
VLLWQTEAKEEVMTITEILTESKITPQKIHQLADRKGMAWDNDAEFMQMTQKLTGKRHLDDLDSAQLRKVYNHINQNLSEGKPRGGLTKWFKEKWVNIAKKEGGKHPACGTSGETSGYAKCVPAKKAASMSAKQKRSAVNRKRAAQRKAGRPGRASGGTGKAPVRVQTDK